MRTVPPIEGEETNVPSEVPSGFKIPGSGVALHVGLGEVAADEDGVGGSWSKSDGLDGGVDARVEGGVQGAIGLEASQVIAACAVVGSEAAADQDFAIGLDGHGLDGGVGACARRVEPGIESAIGIEPGHPALVVPAGPLELSDHHDLAIRLQGHGLDQAEHPVSGIKGQVEHSRVVVDDRDGGGVGLAEGRPGHSQTR